VQDAKQARIRQYFAKIYWAAYMHVSVAHRIPTKDIYFAGSFDDNPFKQRDSVMGELLQANAQIQETLALLALEGGNDEISDAYEVVNDAFNEYVYIFDESGDRDFTALDGAFTRLTDVMRRRYHEMETSHGTKAKTSNNVAPKIRKTVPHKQVARK
jgi:hypothetical protein